MATFLVVPAALAAGCGDSDQCVNGSGPTVSQTLDLSGLTGFDFQAAGEVRAVPGATQQVMVRGQQNIIDRLNQDVINGVWEIGFTECVQNVSELSVDLTVPDLDTVALSGAGTIDAQTEAAEIETTLSGAGVIRLSGESSSQQVVLSGSGTIEAFDLVTAETSVILSGQGNVNVTATDLLNVDLSGAGTVLYRGDPEPNILISGVGTVEQAD
jgi:hypothetical protein